MKKIGERSLTKSITNVFEFKKNQIAENKEMLEMKNKISYHKAAAAALSNGTKWKIEINRTNEFN